MFRFAYILTLCLVAVTFATTSLVTGCAPDQGQFYYGALKLGEPRIVVSSGLAGNYTVALYDQNGNLLKILTDYTRDNLNPRGLSPLNMFSFLVALDGIDQIGIVDMTGQSSTFVSNANLTGNLYQLRQHPSTKEIFAIETNTIESFSANGARIGNPRIATTLGSCVLSTTRGLTFNAAGNLITVGTGNDDVNIYDVAGGGASCLFSNQTLGNVDPVSVIAHTDGYLYISTLLDDSIYRFNSDGSGSGTVIFNNTAVINNPTALLELPDHTILVASDGTNNIVRIDTNGNLVNGGLFIQNGLTGLINDLALMPGDQ